MKASCDTYNGWINLFIYLLEASVKVSYEAHGPLIVVDFEVTRRIQVAIIITEYLIYIYDNYTIRLKQLSWFSHKIPYFMMLMRTPDCALRRWQMEIWNSLFTTKYIVFSESYSVSRNIYWMFIMFFRLVIGIHQTFTWIYHFEFIEQDIKIYIHQIPKAQACVKDYFKRGGHYRGVKGVFLACWDDYQARGPVRLSVSSFLHIKIT